MNNNGNSKSHGSSTLTAALAGAALGAAAVALSHKPTRDKVVHALDNWGNKVDDMKSKGKQKVDELAVKANLAKNEAEDELKQIQKRGRQTVNKVKDAA